MKRFSLSRGAVVGAALLAVAALSACGSSSQSSTSSSAGAGAGSSANTPAGLATATKRLEGYSAKPSLKVVGTPFDASQARGKTVWYTTESFANAVELIWMNGVIDALKPYGVKVNTCDGKGTSTGANQCMGQAVARKPDLIFNLSITPTSIPQNLAAAKAAGIPVVDGLDGTSVVQQGKNWRPGVVAGVSYDYAQVGRMLADWFVSSSQGKGHVLFIANGDVPSTAPEESGFTSEVKSLCSGCSVTVKDVPTSLVTQELPTLVQTTLARDPSINYVIPDYDFMIPTIETSIRQGKLASKVKVGGWNGTPAVMHLVKDNTNVQLESAAPNDLLSHAIADTILRVLTGQKPVTWGLANSGFLGIHTFTPSSLRGLDVSNFNDDEFYGIPFNTTQAAFEKIWGTPK